MSDAWSPAAFRLPPTCSSKFSWSSPSARAFTTVHVFIVAPKSVRKYRTCLYKNSENWHSCKNFLEYKIFCEFLSLFPCEALSGMCSSPHANIIDFIISKSRIFSLSDIFFLEKKRWLNAYMFTFENQAHRVMLENFTQHEYKFTIRLKDWMRVPFSFASICAAITFILELMAVYVTIAWLRRLEVWFRRALVAMTKINFWIIYK